MKQLTDLPAQDLFPIIFNNLSINDLLKCRLVNKQFKYFSDHTDGLDKLIIGQPNSLDDVYWYYNDKLIEDNEIISLKCFRSIRSKSLFNLDKNLKYLKVYCREFKLEELSNLINLESLEFGTYWYCDTIDQQILNLNKLKVLIFDISKFKPFVQLNTPKLEKIQFTSLEKIKFSNPESIKHLITWFYNKNLEKFKNLEIIELTHSNRFINEDILTKFNNLKQLKISLPSYDTELNNSLIRILDKRTKLKRKIDIYFEGVKIENINKFNEFVANKDEIWKFRLKNNDEIWKFRLNNYDLLDLNLPFIYELYFNHLEEFFNNLKNDIPLSFFDKFFNLNEIAAGKKVKNLDWFLKNLKYLKTLTIYSELSLDQVFYNNLPHTIRYLNIYNKKDIDYDFILKLSQLVQFITHVNKDLFNLAFKSFLNLNNLNRFEFRFVKKKINIKKNDQNFHLNGAKSKLNFNQLVEECNKIKVEQFSEINVNN